MEKNKKAPFINLFANRRAFSLTEVMIGIALLGGISLGVMKVINTMNEGQKNISQRFAADQMVYAVTMALRDAQICKAAMGGLNPLTSPSIDYIKSPSGGNVIQINHIYGNTRGRIKATKLQLKDFEKSVDTTIGSTTLWLTFEKQSVKQKQKELNGEDAEVVVRKIRLQVERDATSLEIVHCATAENAYAEAMCSSLGGTYDSLTNVCSNIVVHDQPDPVGTAAVTAIGDMKVDNRLGVGIDPNVQPTILATTDPPYSPSGTEAGVITALGIIQSEADLVVEASSNADFIMASGKGLIGAEEGDIIAKNGNIEAAGKIIATGSGNIHSRGTIRTNEGSISTTTGAILSAANIHTDKGIIELLLGDSTITATDTIETTGSSSSQYVYAEGEMTVNEMDVATQKWVGEFLKGESQVVTDKGVNLSDAERDAVIGYILHETTLTQYFGLKTTIANYVRGETLFQNIDCTTAENSFITKVSGNAKTGFIVTCSTPLVIPSPEANTKCDETLSPNCSNICVNGECRDKLWKSYKLDCASVSYTGGFNVPAAYSGASATAGDFLCPDKSYLQGWTTQIQDNVYATSGSIIGYTGGATQMICCTVEEEEE